MSKKTQVNLTTGEVVTTPTTTVNTKNLFSTYESISLRKIATTLNLNYNMILKTSKKPVPGVAYDPNTVNHDALDAYINDRVEGEVLAQIDWASINDDAAAAAVVLPKEFNVGQRVKVRADEEVYEIILMTITHVVLNPMNNSTQPRVMNNATFMHQGPRNAE